MNSPVETPKSHLAARRKLVRGVFAAPAIMTVCSGNAFANASNLRCLKQHATTGTNSASPPAGATPGPAVFGSLDSWTRVRLRQAGSLYYVSGSDLATVYPSRTSGYLASTSYLQIDGTTGAPIGGSVSLGSVPTSVDKYVVVRFDVNGNVTGMGTTGPGGNVGTSCWNSFK